MQITISKIKRNHCHRSEIIWCGGDRERFVQLPAEMTTGCLFFILYVCFHAHQAILWPLWVPGGFKHIVTVAETTPITVNVITDNGFLWHLLLPPLLRLHRHKIPRPASPGMDWDGMCTIERYTVVTFFDRGALGRRVMARVKGHEPDWTCDIDAVSYVGCRFPLKGEMSVMFFTVLRTMRHVGHQTIDTCDSVKSFLMHFF